MNTQLKAGDRVKVISGNYYSSTPYKEPIASNSECYVHFLDNSDKSILLGFTNGKQRWAHNDDNFKCVEIPAIPKWLPIDRDNLPVERVVAIDINDKSSGVQCGILENHLCVNNIGLSVNGIVSYPYTHYIPLSDLINLPISE